MAGSKKHRLILPFHPPLVVYTCCVLCYAILYLLEEEYYTTVVPGWAGRAGPAGPAGWAGWAGIRGGLIGSREGENIVLFYVIVLTS